MVKNPPANAEDIRDASSITGGGNGNALQYSCLENPMDRGAWWAVVHGVTKSWARQPPPHPHTVIKKKNRSLAPLK